MIIKPIIPIWIMAIICVGLLIFKRKGIIPYLRQILVVALLFAINLRPMVPDGTTNVKMEKMNLRVIFVIDNTISMLAEDYNGSNRRIDGYKKDCEYIVNELSGAKFSVLTYDNKAQIDCPFTNDPQFFMNSINNVEPLPKIYAKGSSIYSVKDLFSQSLQSAAKKGDKVVVFVISDGENNKDDKASFADLATYIDDGAVLGYGTTAGGQMHAKYSFDDYDGTPADVELVESHSDFKPALSKIDEDTLKSIANELNISYVNMNNGNNIKDKVKSIKSMCGTEGDNKEETNYRDVYEFFVIPLCVMLILEFVLYKKERAKI